MGGEEGSYKPPKPASHHAHIQFSFPLALLARTKDQLKEAKSWEGKGHVRAATAAWVPGGC